MQKSLLSENLENWLERGRGFVEQLKTYEKIKTSLRQGFVDTEQTHGSPIPDEYTEAIVRMATLAIYRIWLQKGSNPEMQVTLQEVFDSVIELIKQLSQDGEWKSPRPPFRNWGIPSKRTVDRCVNFSADKKFFLWKQQALGDGHPNMVVTGTINIKPGFYIPNPAKFDEKTRKEMLEEYAKVEAR